MATATRINPQPAYDTSDIMLRVSSDEAIAIKTLAGALTGEKGGGGEFRNATERVYNALKNLGVPSIPNTFVSGSIIRVCADIEVNLEPGFHNYGR